MSLKDEIISKTNEFHSQKFKLETVAVVPTVETKQLTFGCNGWSFDAVVLYIDMRHSTELLDEHRRNVIAKLHMSYYHAIVKIAKADGGEIRSFNGDSLLVFYLGNNTETVDRAVRSAFRMRYAITELVNPILKDYSDINFGIGIDMGNIIATKVGIGGDNTTKDLIWLGDAVNRSTKISDECEAPFYVGISDEVFNHLSDNLKTYTEQQYSGWGITKDVWQICNLFYNNNYETYHKSSCYIELK